MSQCVPNGLNLLTLDADQILTPPASFTTMQHQPITTLQCSNFPTYHTIYESFLLQEALKTD